MNYQFQMNFTTQGQEQQKASMLPHTSQLSALNFWGPTWAASSLEIWQLASHFLCTFMQLFKVEVLEDPYLIIYNFIIIYKI